MLQCFYVKGFLEQVQKQESKVVSDLFMHPLLEETWAYNRPKRQWVPESIRNTVGTQQNATKWGSQHRSVITEVRNVLRSCEAGPVELTYLHDTCPPSHAKSRASTGQLSVKPGVTSSVLKSQAPEHALRERSGTLGPAQRFFIRNSSSPSLVWPLSRASGGLWGTRVWPKSTQSRSLDSSHLGSLFWALLGNSESLCLTKFILLI